MVNASKSVSEVYAIANRVSCEAYALARVHGISHLDAVLSILDANADADDARIFAVILGDDIADE